MVATTLDAAAAQLADALKRRFGSARFTARELADAIVELDAPLDLIGALDDALAAAAAVDEEDELDVTLWGPEPSDAAVAGAHRRDRQVADDALRRVLTGSLTRQDVAQRLGITPQMVSRWLTAGRLVALRPARRWRFAAWQFDERGALPGLERVIAGYPGTPLSLSIWATTASPDLNGVTPAQALTRRNGDRRVLELIHALAADAW